MCILGMREIEISSKEELAPKLLMATSYTFCMYICITNVIFTQALNFQKEKL